MAKEIGTNDLIETWASNGSVVEPTLGKQNDGWQFEEQPPHEHMNWIHNILGQQINYMMRAGIPEWSAATDYVIGSVVTNEGVIWMAAANNANSEPTDGNTNWSAFDPAAFAPVERGVPVGAVQAFAMETAPAGWLRCDGAAVSRTTYAALFSAIGTAHGSGDGTTTFNLPDLRGEFVRGLDLGRGVDSGRSLGSAQADEIKSHRHFPKNIAGGDGLPDSGITVGPFEGNIGDGKEYAATTYTGGAETRPRNVALMYAIKV